MTECKPAGVILAGGRSSRMGGQPKALVELAGRPLLAHVLERLRPQVDRLLLSCDEGAAGLGGFGERLVADIMPGFRGPLAGLYSALQHLADSGHDGSVVLCPCDAPFVPAELVQRLMEADGGGKPVVPAWQGVLQPTFSMWGVQHLETVREMLMERGMGGPRQVLAILQHEVVEWEHTEPPPFFNVNTPQDIAMARSWLDRPIE